MAMVRKTIFAATLAATLLTTATAQAGGWYGHRGYPHYYGHHHHHGDGLAIALGVTGALVGTAILVDALSGPRYVAPAPVYYYPPPPPPVYYQSPPVYYQSAPATDAYAEGYRAGQADARAWSGRIDYPRIGRPASNDAPYYGR